MDCFACARNDDVETHATFSAVITRRRVIQYSEALVVKLRSRGVLDTPHARGMTALFLWKVVPPAAADLVKGLSLARGLARCRSFAHVSLAGRGRLLRGTRSRRGRPACRCLAAARSTDPAAALRGHVGVGNAAARAALVAAA